MSGAGWILVGGLVLWVLGALAMVVMRGSDDLRLVWRREVASDWRAAALDAWHRAGMQVDGEEEASQQ